MDNWVKHFRFQQMSISTVSPINGTDATQNTRCTNRINVQTDELLTENASKVEEKTVFFFFSSLWRMAFSRHLLIHRVG